MTALYIKNDGPRIAATNYWESGYARAGIFYISVNASTFRLLVPSVRRNTLADMRTAHEVVISRGPWPAAGRQDAIELMFEDGSDVPFALHVGTEQIDRLPLASDVGREVRCTVWTAGPVEALSLPAYYRIVERLPCMEPRK
jgi:hypothetical protein